MSNQLSTKEIYTLIWSANKTNLPQKIIASLRAMLPKSSPQSSFSGKKLAFVVGHNPYDKGAYAYPPLEISEWDLNKAIGLKMVELSEYDTEIEVKVFYRKNLGSYTAEIAECYKRVEAWSPDLIMEGHFDWQVGVGKTHVLYYGKSSESKKASEFWLRNASELIGGNNNEITPTYGGNGFKSLISASAPTLLLEPFDASNEEHNTRASQLTPEDFARAYNLSAKEYFRTI